MIRLDKKFKLEKCVTKDDGRPSMKHICFERDFAVSTDGYNMAIIKVDRDPEDRMPENDLLLTEVFTQARKINGKFGEIILDLNDRDYVKLANGITYPRRIDEKYPGWYNVIPDQKSQFSIGINAKKLYELSQALGTEELAIEVISPFKPMRVYPTDINSQAFGLCMPVPACNYKNTECNERIVLDTFRPVKVEENNGKTDNNEQKQAI